MQEEAYINQRGTLTVTFGRFSYVLVFSRTSWDPADEVCNSAVFTRSFCVGDNAAEHIAPGISPLIGGS